MKLGALIAIEQSTKARGNALKSDLYKTAQKPALFDGTTKKYRPKDETGEKYPDEKKKVQHTAEALVDQVGSCLRDLFDVEATKDWANCEARADIVVGGHVLVESAPATFLLYLNKELTDLHTFVSKLPTLPDDEEWKRDDAVGLWRTAPVETVKTKKVDKALILYPHQPTTPPLPAQTQLVTSDEIVGYWESVKMTGAMAPADQKALLTRIQKLADAVRVAVAQANTAEAPPRDAGSVLLKWMFEK